MKRLSGEELNDMTTEEVIELLNELMEGLEDLHRLVMADPLGGIYEIERLPLGLGEVRSNLYKSIKTTEEMIGQELITQWRAERRMKS